MSLVRKRSYANVATSFVKNMGAAYKGGKRLGTELRRLHTQYKRRKTTSKPSYKRRKNGKPRPRRRAAKARLRKTIKKVVNSELQCKNDVGVYRKTYWLDQAIVNNLAHKNFWLNGGANYATSTVAYGLPGLRWTPFARKRILDAASVLYNGKVPKFNYELEPNNFSITDLKVDVIYASMTIFVKNLTSCGLTFCIYKATNKNNSNISFLDTVNANITNTAIEAYSDMSSQVLELVSTGTNRYAGWTNFKLSDLKSVTREYSIEKHKVYLKPGDSTTLNYSVANKCYDFSRETTIEGTPVIPDYAKGDLQIVMQVEPNLTFSKFATGSTAGTACRNTSDDSSTGISIEQQEVFKIMMPDKTTDAYTGERKVLYANCPVQNPLIAKDGWCPSISFENTQTG